MSFFNEPLINLQKMWLALKQFYKFSTLKVKFSGRPWFINSAGQLNFDLTAKFHHILKHYAVFFDKSNCD